MRRRRTPARLWLITAVVAIVIHAAAFAVCARRDRPRTPEERLRAVFERNHRQITNENHEKLWYGLTPTYRAQILEWEAGGDGSYDSYDALRRKTSENVDKYPGLELGGWVSSRWDGESEYVIAIDGRAALVVYPSPSRPIWECFQEYVRLDEIWYLDGQGCAPNQILASERLKDLLGSTPTGDRTDED